MVKLYKIRNITTKNSTGDAYGITIPQAVHDKVSGTSFKINDGESLSLQIEELLITKLNTTFKSISLEVPSEYYPRLKYSQIELRNTITETLNPLKNGIVLTSGAVIEKKKEVQV